MLYGAEPALPLDLTEATFLVEGFKSGMSTADLLALRIKQLQKKPEDIEAAAAKLAGTRLKSKEQFESRYRHRLYTAHHKEGGLVLVRNTTIEKSLNRKCKPRYLGPYEVVRRTQGGAYILKELDGSVWRQKVAAFRLLPYVTRDDPRFARLTQEKVKVTELNEEESDSDY